MGSLYVHEYIYLKMFIITDTLINNWLTNVETTSTLYQAQVNTEACHRQVNILKSACTKACHKQ